MDQFLKPNEGKKWINGILALAGVLSAYIIFAFLRQMGEWFDLEAKIGSFNGIAQVVSILLGLVSFILLFKSEQVQQHLNEVYAELTKVTWATKDDTMKLTIGILVGIFITSAVLGVVDYLINKLFGLIY
ncbi:MAG: preprotein translocase subunit SecE [Oligoflexia bacterium]|nr:preprotein translocase subunit SecE [Oligoflexia bacterium]